MNLFKYIPMLVVFVILILLLMIIPKSPENDENQNYLIPIPNEVAHKEGYVKYSNAPEDYKASVAWMQAIHEDRREGKSKVEVDWIRLYARVDGKDIIIAHDNFDEQKVCGGLFSRNPWYGITDETGEEIIAYFNFGILVLEPSKKPNKVWHWWNCNRASIPLNASNIWMESRVRITGPALVQVGIDYWKDLSAPDRGGNTNNLEAGASDWYFEKKDWQIITVAKQ